MTPRTIIHVTLAILYLMAVIYVYGRWHSEAWQENPMYPLLAIILLAVSGGIAFVTLVLPNIGDAIGTVIYSSNEDITHDPKMNAAAKLAAGDYEGAIAEYEKTSNENPDDPFPISEISKIYSDKLHETEKALIFLQEHLEAHSWPEEDAAFLMFRIVDIQLKVDAFDDAKDILEQVIGNMPGTRHSANAKHKIQEIEVMQFKHIQAQLASAAGHELEAEEPLAEEGLAEDPPAKSAEV